ncbi:MAG: hypothetical protein ACRER1_05100 [Gammaproteobacteria bacterium]
MKTWDDIEFIGHQIDQVDGCKWASLASVLIWDSRRGLDNGLKFNRCKYCWRPASKKQLCSLHQGTNAENGYRKWRRMCFWAISVIGKEKSMKSDWALKELFKRECKDVRNELRSMPRGTLISGIFDYFPNVHRWWRGQKLSEPDDVVDVLVGLFGCDKKTLLAQSDLRVWATRGFVALVWAEAWMCLEQAYGQWRTEQRKLNGKSEGGRPRKWSREALTRAQKLYDGGASLREIEEQTEIPRSTLSKRLTPQSMP